MGWNTNTADVANLQGVGAGADWAVGILGCAKYSTSLLEWRLHAESTAAERRVTGVCISKDHILADAEACQAAAPAAIYTGTAPDYLPDAFHL